MESGGVLFNIVAFGPELLRNYRLSLELSICHEAIGEPKLVAREFWDAVPGFSGWCDCITMRLG